MSHNFFDDALMVVRSYVEREHGGNISRASTALGMAGDTLHKWLSGTRSPKLEAIGPILDQLGFTVTPQTIRRGEPTPSTDTEPAPSIRRMGEYSPVERLENAENEFTMPIPVYAEVGAGNDIELVEEVPICTISILKSYYTDTRMYAALVSGDSMTPTIKKGAYVGIVPMYGQLEEGEIYLVQRPHFGKMVKRVFLSPDSLSIILRSDNPRFEDLIIPMEEHRDVILGKVKWVMQVM